MTRDPLAPKTLSSIAAHLYEGRRALGCNGERLGGVVDRGRRVVTLAEAGGRDKTAASRGCSGERDGININDLHQAKLPAKHLEHAGGLHTFSIADSGIAASIPLLGDGAAP